MSEQKIVVTGGAGFIGSHLVETWLRAGRSVAVFDNLSTGKLENFSTSVRSSPLFSFHSGDISSSTDLARVFESEGRVQAVVHLAGQVSVQDSLRFPADSARVNILGFVNVLEACRAFDVRRVVYASSAAVYGAASEGRLDESSPVQPISPYGVEKLSNELHAQCYQSCYGQSHSMSLLGLRFFNVYGPRQDPRSPYSGVVSRFVHQLQQRLPVQVYGDGLQTRDFLYVGDVAKVIEQAIGSRHCGVLAVGTGSSRTLLDLIDAIGSAYQTQPAIQFTPAKVGDIVHSAMNPAALTRALGVWVQTGLEEGIRLTLQSGELADQQA